MALSLNPLPPTDDPHSWPTPETPWEDTEVWLGQWPSWDSNCSLWTGRRPSRPGINNPAVFCFPPNSPRGPVKLGNSPLVVSARVRPAQAPPGLLAARPGWCRRKGGACPEGRGVSRGRGVPSPAGKAEGLQGVQSGYRFQNGFERAPPWRLLAAESWLCRFRGCVGSALSAGFQRTCVQIPWRRGNVQGQGMRGWAAEGAGSILAPGALCGLDS